MTIDGLERLPDALPAGYFERLFEGAGLAVFACDALGGIRAANSLARQLVNAVSPDLSIPDLRSLFPESDRPTFDTHLADVLRTGEPTEFRSRFVLGERTVEYAVWFAPLPDESGLSHGASVWFHDITARMAVRQGMRKRERLGALGSMSGSVAHHYNNMLCGIATSLEYAMNMNTMQAMKRALQRTADGVSRAAQLTKQLLAFAQADHSACDRGCLAETVRGFVRDHQQRMHARGVTMTFVEQPIPRVDAPREIILAILEQLTTNAAEAMRSGGTMRIELGPSGDTQVRLSVSDTGTGIRPEHMERLFEPFFTTKGVLADGDARNAGMGLAVVHGLVVGELRGQVAASNIPGGGARFEILLPVAN